MKLVKVGAAVLNQTPLAWKRNQNNILKAIEEARSQRVSLLCLPELCITGYGCEDAFHSPGVLETSWRMLGEIIPATRGLMVCVGLPLVYRNGIFNCVAFVADGKLLGFVAKKYLAGDGIHYEPRWFKPWPAGVRTEILLDGHAYPFGDLGFDMGGLKVGFEICEDAWVAKRPGGDLAARGIDVILNPSASHFAFGKHAIRERFVIEGSRAFSATYLYANLVGCEAGRVIYDGGALVASGGRLVAAGRRLSFEEHSLSTAVVDVSQTRMNQWRSASFRPALEAPTGDFVSAPFSFPELREGLPPETPPAKAAWEASPHLKEEEFARAVALGLFDYMRKSHSQGFVLSLSGGADSSAVAVLVDLMSQLGVAELGLDRYIQRLSHIPALVDTAEPRLLTTNLLTTVYQATRNSGEVTRNAARGVAQALRAGHLELDVDPLVESYKAIVGKGIGRELNWQRDDLALQNIQARVRGPSVWMLANVQRSLLLTTSNRSEAAVGYATMDGDTCGGLCPVGGIDKAFLRRWLVWMEKEGPAGLGPIPALSLVNEQQPTAELRPSEEGQTDESDLMPYEVLDAIERAAIRDKKMPLEVYRLMRVRFPHYRPEDIATWVQRFYRLWSINQWKRERYAPSFHLDDENLDPKTWCRFPILSGSYEMELEELRQEL